MTFHGRFTHTKKQIDSVLPQGVRILALARAIRWAGWGLGESFIPILILSVSSTYFEMGLLSAVIEMAGLVSLPVIGVWADERWPAKRLVLVSLLAYPMVGVSYFLAGALGAAGFIVLARAVNGFIWGLENVGIETYYRREANRNSIASAFGYLDALSHGAWIVAALVGILLVQFVPMHYLLLGIAPFSMLAFGAARKAPADRTNVQVRQEKTCFFRGYTRLIGECREWNGQLWALSVLVLFTSLLNTFVTFFVPIGAYLAGGNLILVALIGVFGALPSLFGLQLGRIADSYDKAGLMTIGLLIAALILSCVGAFSQFWVKLLAVFMIGIILVLLNVIKSSLVTTIGAAQSYGVRGSAFESIQTIGDLVAPLVLGIALDALGFTSVTLIIAGGAAVLAAMCHAGTKAEMETVVGIGDASER